MYISEEQINAVVKVLEDNEKKLTDRYNTGDTNEIFMVAIYVIEELNKVIYNGT